MKTQITQLEKKTGGYVIKPTGKIFIGFKNKESWSKYVIRLKKRKRENVSGHIDQILYADSH
jgi:hypothetical protein